MEWFKHKTGSLDDPDFNLILDEFGSDGYMMFFGLLEIYGREYSDVDSDGFLHISSGFVARKLRKSSAKVRKFLNFCQKNLKKTPWEYSVNGNSISYKVPKFIDLSSNWTKRQHNTPTEAPTEAPLKKRTTEEEERSKKKKENKDNASKKASFGEFGNVLLSVAEIQKLKDKFGNTKTNHKIEALSEYIESKGVKYKSHYATLLSWDRRDNPKKKKPKTPAWL